MITAIALDDEPLALMVIKNFCDQSDAVKLLQTFSSTREAADYLANNSVDLLFLDIQMPGMSGIDFYKGLDSNTMVIFTTAFSEYAVEGFNLSAIDYLLKPFELSRFQQALTKAKDYYEYRQGRATHNLFIKVDYSVVKIPVADIVYIEGLDNYLKLHFTNRKPIIARMSMKSILEKLPEKQFLRVHRSYIVAIDKVQSLRNKQLQMPDVQIPVGSNYADAVSAFFNA
jgi:Response regulator of the LytR/AlgR family